MAKRKVRKPPAIDSRLIGTWKSDRRRTFRRYKPKPTAPARSIRKLKSLFGKLVVRWGRGKYYTEMDGDKWSNAYEVIASDQYSVVVRSKDDLSAEPRLQQIHFEGDWYWLAISPGLCEYFKRVTP